MYALLIKNNLRDDDNYYLNMKKKKKNAQLQFIFINENDVQRRLDSTRHRSFDLASS
jgi:hypothetical protein